MNTRDTFLLSALYETADALLEAVAEHLDRNDDSNNARLVEAMTAAQAVLARAERETSLQHQEK